ncbi:MAG TPA: PBSX family phage terminase large subunit [Gammaproteobacteria bacterium]|nr:PBSX family phage terminase large subunit [Gammaproteobacteria bacterium]
MTTVRIELPPKIAANFSQPAKHRVFRGGRGSAKTKALAKMAVIYGYKFAEAGREGIILASREHLNSLDESSLEEIKGAIRSEPWLDAYYEIGEKYVRTKNRRVSFAFAGLRHNLDGIKSKARILLNWTDEAESVSETAWRKLIPTIRGGDDLENWISYNPESPDSATHRRFIVNNPPRCIVTDINWRDNPWWTESGLEEERLYDQKYNPDTYDHVWEGAFLTMTEAQVFAGKHRVEEFEPLADWQGPYQGIDFGFRPDPLAALQCWIHDDQVWIRREAYSAKIEIDATAGFITDRIPRFAEYAARADSAEPKTISYLSRNGLPRIEPVKKWPNSVEEGVRFLRGFKCIVIHPDCPNTARDFRLYSHKIDRNTGDILPDLLDANNHAPDALRYALAPIIKAQAGGKVQIRI